MRLFSVPKIDENSPNQHGTQPCREIVITKLPPDKDTKCLLKCFIILLCSPDDHENKTKLQALQLLFYTEIEAGCIQFPVSFTLKFFLCFYN